MSPVLDFFAAIAYCYTPRYRKMEECDVIVVVPSNEYVVKRYTAQLAELAEAEAFETPDSMTM